ncbi:MAG: DUF1846 domain-containing protein [Clostridia bacterium]|nr:DUF1846 domain-containing protein [Clostridia bacterium]
MAQRDNINRIGFDNTLYLAKQQENIIKRIDTFGNKLYLEFGGKLFDDLHASRVLPGYDANSKVKLLGKFTDKAEVIFCISSRDIVRNKMRADFGITYSQEALRVIDNLRAEGILVSSIVITLYENDVNVNQYINNLRNRGENVYLHRTTRGYPLDVDTIVSDEGYGQNCYIPTTRPLVVVTAPGPGSGKLATCLNQLYHEYKRGNRAGYAKFETFPIWNLSLSHPVNVAYEAATADLNDINVIDYYHQQSYGISATNYNRDMETFPIVNNILYRITGKEVYCSPTDMGVNMTGFAITDDETCREAARQEVILRYYRARVDSKMGAESSALARLEQLMAQLGINPHDRHCVLPALEYNRVSHMPITAIQLSSGKIITGKQSALLTSTSAALLNALKELAGIDDDVKLLPEQVIAPILTLNQSVYKLTNTMMTLSQVLIALSMSQAYDDNATLAMSKLPLLKGCQAHSTCIVTADTSAILAKLGIEHTSEDVFASTALFTQ